MIKAKDVVQVPKLRFPEFDGEWATKKLGDTSKVKHGFAFKGEYFASKGKYIVLTPGNFNPEGGFRYQGGKEKYYTNSNFPSEYILQKGEILTVMTEQAVGLIGSALIVPESGIFLHNQRLGLFQTGPEIIRIFLFHYLKTIKLRILLSNTAAGTKVRHTSPQKIESVNIFYPTLPEQQIIASFLSEVDQKIQQLTRKKELLEQYKRGVMQKIFSREIRFKDENGKDYPDWEDAKFEKIADKSVKWSITGGPFGSDLKSEDYTESGVRIIQLQNIGDGIFYDDYKIYTSEEKADSLIACNIFPNEIILSKMGDPVARACFIPDSNSRWLMASDGIRLVVDKRKYDAKYIHEYINSPLFRRIAFALSTGTTRKRIGLGELKKIPIMHPCLEEQKQIGNYLLNIDKKIESLQTQLTQTQTFKKGLLQQMYV